MFNSNCGIDQVYLGSCRVTKLYNAMCEVWKTSFTRPTFLANTYDPVTFEMTGVQIGIGDLIEARAYEINLPDYTGVIQTIPGNVPGYEDGRIVRNLSDWSEDLSQGWYGPARVTWVDGIITILGDTNAWYKKIENIISGNTYTISYVLENISTTTFKYLIGSNLGTIATAIYPDSFNTTRQRFSITLTPEEGITELKLFPARNTLVGEQFYINNVQVEMNALPGEYVKTFADPTFKTFANYNGNTVVDNAVVPATGALLPQVPKLASYPLTKNWMRNSSDVNNITYWKKAPDNTTPNGVFVTAPDNSSIEGCIIGNRSIYQNADPTEPMVVGEWYTASCWIKANKSLTIGLRGGGAANDDTDIININVTTEWQRFVAPSQATTTSDARRVLVDNRTLKGFSGDPDLELWIWGAQLEEGAKATPPVYATTVQVTRDACALSYDAANHDNVQGTYLIEAQFNTNEQNIFSDFLKTISTNIRLTDGSNFVDVMGAVDTPHKIGIVYGNGTMRLNVDSIWSTEIAYDGTFPDSVLDLFRNSTGANLAGMISRYPISDEAIVNTWIPSFVANTYDPDTFEMLGVEVGTGDITEDRAYEINLPDYAGVIQTIPGGIPGYEDGRVVRNLSTYSDDLSQAMYGSAEVDWVDGIATIVGSSNLWYKRVDGVVTGRSYTFSYMLENIDVASFTYAVFSNAGTIIGQTAYPDSFDTVRQRFSITVTVPPGANDLRIILSRGGVAAGGEQFYISDIQCNEGDSPGERILTTDSPVVKIFANEDGNTVTDRVVTEGVGALLPQVPRLASYALTKNWLRNSSDINATSYWSFSSAGSSPNGVFVTAPDGASVEGRLIGDNSVYQDASPTEPKVVGNWYTASCWVRANKNITIGMRGGGTGDDPASAININVTTEWQRFIAPSQAATTSDQRRLLIDNRTSEGYPGDADLELWIWGAQWEEGAVATPPVYTTTVQVTRDACELSYDLANHDNAQGAYLVDVTLLENVTARDESIIATQPAEFSLLYSDATPHRIASTAVSGTASVNHADNTTIEKIGVAYDSVANKLAINVDGVWSTESSYSGFLEAGGLLRLGYNSISGKTYGPIIRHDVPYDRAVNIIDTWMTE